MIISASRRTDIPSYYSDWFLNRLNEGFVYVRNPMNVNQISNISLSPDVVDCIVFWTKNPEPLIERLNELENYPFYFLFTLNPYDKEVEAGLPNKEKIIKTFQKLSDLIGPERIVWRYDPVFLSDKYTVSYHLENFEKLAGQLNGFTEKIIFSYIDFYSKIEKNISNLNIRDLSFDEKNIIADGFSAISRENNLLIETCAEDLNLSQYGINHAHCINEKLIERLTGSHLNLKKDKNQRLECSCVESIDIGAYNSCLNDCRYCYANHSKSLVVKNSGLHNSLSPLLIGDVTSKDVIKDRSLKSNKKYQKELFNF
ncbi:hypothetical protein MsAg5_11840 [Methanosarcinaceae archaeon Ag5]|uniref:DUF1848 domain-containing protein n=1 Tax=Methanolapillus africanus TaxID=3028297 RepID=A0AAE4MJW6_9EURY|nr:hypothetical protein [Methanosarcinaceae archaeon Ag5]